MSRYSHESYEDRPRRRYFPSDAGGLVTAGLTLLGGLAVGGAMMFLLDPDEGPKRRKYIRKSAGGALHSVGDLLGSAYDSVSDSASSLASTATDSASHAGKFLRRHADNASDLVSEYTEDDDGIGTGTILSLVLGGSALAAVAYMLTTEYDSIRRGDFRGAATHAYRRASDAVTGAYETASGAVTDAAHRTSEYFSGSDQPGRQQA